MTAPTKQPAIDIDAASVGHELDAAIIEYVLCWEYVPEKEMWEVPVPERDKWMVTRMYTAELPFSTDMTSTRIVEAEIERRGLQYQYAAHLAREFGIEVFGFTVKNFGNSAILASQVYSLITATPEQRCRAALRAVMG